MTILVSYAYSTIVLEQKTLEYIMNKHAGVQLSVLNEERSSPCMISGFVEKCPVFLRVPTLANTLLKSKMR